MKTCFGRFYSLGPHNVDLFCNLEVFYTVYTIYSLGPHDVDLFCHLEVFYTVYTIFSRTPRRGPVLPPGSVLACTLYSLGPHDVDLSCHLDVFYMCILYSLGPHDVDLSCHLDVFYTVYNRVQDTPQEIPFLSILQHLLRSVCRIDWLIE